MTEHQEVSKHSRYESDAINDNESAATGDSQRENNIKIVGHDQV